MAGPGRKLAKHKEGIQSQWQRLGYIIRLASLGSKALIRFAQTPMVVTTIHTLYVKLGKIGWSKRRLNTESIAETVYDSHTLKLGRRQRAEGRGKHHNVRIHHQQRSHECSVVQPNILCLVHT